MLNELFITVNEWMTGGIFVAALGCFLWGMISVLFSPCHLASIPLIISYVTGQKETVGAGRAVRYALAFTMGLFVTIAVIGIACSLVGRMLGQISPYWTILVGLVLIWVALEMLGVEALSISGSVMNRLKVRGITGALVLGLAYGLLSGSCTFGFIAPILAVITVQEKIATGILLIVLFGVGHCLPIALAGSSAALARRFLENKKFQAGSMVFRRISGGIIMLLALYFIVRPFVLF